MQILAQMKQMRLVSAGIESPIAKSVMSGGVGKLAVALGVGQVAMAQASADDGHSKRAGFGLGAFFSLMGSSMSIEDPFRAPQHEVTNQQLIILARPPTRADNLSYSLRRD